MKNKKINWEELGISQESLKKMDDIHNNFIKHKGNENILIPKHVFDNYVKGYGKENNSNSTAD